MLFKLYIIYLYLNISTNKTIQYRSISINDVLERYVIFFIIIRLTALTIECLFKTLTDKSNGQLINGFIGQIYIIKILLFST